LEGANLRVDFIPSEPDTEVLARELAEAIRWREKRLFRR